MVSLGVNAFLQLLNTPLKVYRIFSVLRSGEIPPGDKEYFSAKLKQFSRKCNFFFNTKEIL
jgi:hypothetical protein